MKRLLRFCIVALLVAFGIIWYAVRAPSDQGSSVTIPDGEGVNQISVRLHEARIIRSKLAFETYVWAIQAERSLLAGSYFFTGEDTIFDVVRKLRSEAENSELRVTLIEGWNNREYRDYLTDIGFVAEAFDSAVSDGSTWSSRYAFLDALPRGRSLEGFLYPDTYLVLGPDAERLVDKMLSNFGRKVDEIVFQGFADAGLTPYEGIILASIVEREVPSSADRRTVAGIFLNRLSVGMALQSDATITYLTGSTRSRSTADDLAIDSPYNTYKYPGLPPGPIGNPSIDALQAVANAADTDYVYFLTDAEGTVRYGRTFEDHQRNRAEYLQ